MKKRDRLTARQQFIADAIRETGGNIAEFARVCGVPDRTVRSWIKGDRDPTPESLHTLAANLDAYGAALIAKTVDLASRARLLADQLEGS